MAKGSSHPLLSHADGIATGGSKAIVLPDFEPAPWPINLLYRGGRLLPVKLRAFLDFAAPRLKAGLADRADQSGSPR